jgi:hypothetical protein
VRRWLISLLGILLGLSALLAQTSYAGPSFYADAGGSIVQIHSPSPFWANGAPNASIGYGLNYGIWTTFSNNDPALNLQFGVVNRYSSASGNGATYGFMAAYPVLRLQISRIFISAGATPLVWQSLDYNGVSYGIQRAVGAMSYLGEAGILFPITPKFSFGASATAEYVKQNSVSSPSPIGSANLLMRFYFDFDNGSHQSSEFRGWRYPFGQN